MESMGKLKWLFILPMVLIVLTIPLALFSVFLSDRVSKSNSIPGTRKEISGICDPLLSYNTKLSVSNEAGAQKAFRKYIDYLKSNKLKDENLAVDWDFVKAEEVGFYKGLRYWVISFHYVTEDKSEGNSQIYVNEKGGIMQLLKCI